MEKARKGKGSMAASSSSSARRLPPTLIASTFPTVDSPPQERAGPFPFQSASPAPWIWSIQAMATCNKLRISTLRELVKAIPVEKDDYGEKTNELIALRCLEHLYDSAQRGNCDAASASVDSRIRIDCSRSCEDVMLQIYDKVPLLTMEKLREEVLKWDVLPFIMHKKVAIKCDLEQLKDSISDGTHPYTHCLRERSGLAHQNGDHPVPANDNECSALSEKNGNKSSKESLLDKIIPSKRNRVVSLSANKHVTGYQHEKLGDINECDNSLVNAKKIRCNASLNVESKKEKPVSPHGKRVLENSSENFLLVSERGDGDTDKDCGAEISSDTDWDDNETDDFTAQKLKFLSSHCTFGHDFSATTRLTKNNLCMKCNEVGELLVCKMATCPIMVHKTCLSTSAQIDEEGNFFCPFCAYCRDISEYHEVKKEASLARTELAFFICKGLLNRETNLHHEVNRKKEMLSKKKCSPVARSPQSRQKQYGGQPKRKS